MTRQSEPSEREAVELGGAGSDETMGWSAAALSANPHAATDKAARVRSMFSSIARRYDLNNRLHSFGLDQRWRRQLVRAVGHAAQGDVIDVACGTGDLSEAFAAAGAASVIGIDCTPPMLEVAREKSRRRRPESGVVPEYRVGDACSLELPDASADVVSIAFGIRNVSDPARALAEFRRVLRSDGRLAILEFSEPRNGAVRWLNRLYTHQIMPRTATLIAGDRTGAYRYLPRSVETFFSAEGLASLAQRAGFADVEQKELTLGVCTITVARRR